MIVRELVALLGFKVDDAGAKKFDAVLGDIAQKAAGVVASVVSIGASIKSIEELIDFSSATRDQAGAIGITTSALQELDFAATQSGASVEILRRGLVDMAAASAGVTGRGKQVAQLLATIGVSAKDAQGRGKPAEELFVELAGALAKVPDQGKRVAIAMRVLGDSGRELVPLLNEGADGLQALRQEARDLGLVVDGEVISAAGKLGDQLDAVKGVALSLSRVYATQFIPLLNELAERTLMWSKENGRLLRSGIKEFASYMVGALRLVSSVVSGLARAMVEVVDGVGGAENAVRILGVMFIFLNRSMIPLVLRLGLVGAAFYAIALLIGDVAAYEKHGDAVDSLTGRFKKAFFDTPFRANDSPLLVFLKLLARAAGAAHSAIVGLTEVASDLVDIIGVLNGTAAVGVKNRTVLATGDADLGVVRDSLTRSLARYGLDPQSLLAEAKKGLGFGGAAGGAEPAPPTIVVPTINIPVGGSPRAGAQVTQTNNITITGTPDPQAAAAAVATRIRQANAVLVEE